MRTLEQLIELFPTKSGTELLQLQEMDRLADKHIFQMENKANLDIVNNINTNGAFYRGNSGDSQYFYYRVFKADFDSKKQIININYDILLLFTDCKGFNFSFEIKRNEYAKYDNLGLSLYEKVTKEDWDKAIAFTESIPSLLWDVKKD